MNVIPMLVGKNEVFQEIYSIETKEGEYTYIEYVDEIGYVSDFILKHPLGYNVTNDPDKAALLEAIQNNLP